MRPQKREFRAVLERRLRNRIPNNRLHLLPSGFQKIGDIIIINLPRELVDFSGVIGDAILNAYNVKTVCNRTGRITGKCREPQVRKIAGGGTETVHRENGCLYKIDVSRLMFSKGNVTERGRVAGLVKPCETIVDMFSGIGYFSIPIARQNPSCTIFCIDKNPTATGYLKENCRLNNIHNIRIFKGDCRKVGAGSLDGVADRVLMGYLPDTYKFLSHALGFLKDKGIIHYHDTFRKGELWDRPLELLEKYASEAGYRTKGITYKRIVKPYAPNTYHIIMDVCLSRI